MNFKNFIRKHYLSFNIFSIILGTFIMFYALYFSDKPFSLETFKENLDNFMMYLCLLFSFLGSFIINKIV